jgi:MarR family transcriptional regulator, organic hydroperoxide resistance regulator
VSSAASVRKQSTDKRSRPRALSFDTYIPFLVNRAATAMITSAASEFEPHGLTVPKWRVLFLLWERETCSFATCMELASIGAPTFSRLTAKMERERLIVRTRVPEDTRALELTITAKGRELVETLMPVAINNEKSYLDGVTAAERTALRSALGKIYRNVTRNVSL